VLVLALGLVGMAVDAANYRGAVSALQVRMESYVYTVLAAMEVDAAGNFTVEEDFADPRLLQPGSGLYVQVSGQGAGWRSASSLGIDLPVLPVAAAGIATFSEPAAEQSFFTYRYGVGWQQENGGITPFTVSVLIDDAELGQQTRAFRIGLWRSLVLAGGILVLAQVIIGLLVLRPLRQVAQDVAGIESGEAKRLEGDYPRELEPLARNVNRLLETEQSNQARTIKPGADTECAGFAGAQPEDPDGGYPGRTAPARRQIGGVHAECTGRDAAPGGHAPRTCRQFCAAHDGGAGQGGAAVGTNRGLPAEGAFS
jgi:two-component system sensor histidine kinase PhoQ